MITEQLPPSGTKLPEKIPKIIEWKWFGPEVERIGRKTILYLWRVKDFNYQVLRVNPPSLPLQYAASGPRSEWSCIYIPDLNTAMYSCEKFYAQLEKDFGSNIIIKSNRTELVWKERKALARIYPTQETKLYHPGELVPISYFQPFDSFILLKKDGTESIGRIIDVNQDWTMETQLESKLVALPMNTLVSVTNPTILRRRDMMEILESDARELFIAIGYKVAADEKLWPAKRLLGKLNRLQEFTKEVAELSDERLHTLAIGICNALNDGVNIVLTESASSDNSNVAVKEQEMTTDVLEKDQTVEQDVKLEEENGQEAPPAKKKGGRKKKVEGEKKEKAAVKYEMDKYGCRVGSENAKLNAALDDAPKTMHQLVEEAGLKRGLYGHIKAMIKKGHVKETKEGEKRLYSLV